MQNKRTCPHCGADMTDDSTPAPDVVEKPCAEGSGVAIGPPVVEHQRRDYLGRPFGVAGIDDVDIPITDK